MLRYRVFSASLSSWRNCPMRHPLSNRAAQKSASTGLPSVVRSALNSSRSSGRPAFRSAWMKSAVVGDGSSEMTCSARLSKAPRLAAAEEKSSNPEVAEFGAGTGRDAGGSTGGEATHPVSSGTKAASITIVRTVALEVPRRPELGGRAWVRAIVTEPRFARPTTNRPDWRSTSCILAGWCIRLSDELAFPRCTLSAASSIRLNTTSTRMRELPSSTWRAQFQLRRLRAPYESVSRSLHSSDRCGATRTSRAFCVGVGPPRTCRKR